MDVWRLNVKKLKFTSTPEELRGDFGGHVGDGVKFSRVPVLHRGGSGGVNPVASERA